jgi:hypothetical protein
MLITDLKDPRLEFDTLCPQCGPRPLLDEDGACAHCGSDAQGAGVDVAMQSLRAALTEIDLLKSCLEYCESPCGHSSVYAFTDDGGKTIICLQCRSNKLAAALSRAEAAEGALCGAREIMSRTLSALIERAKSHDSSPGTVYGDLLIRPLKVAISTSSPCRHSEEAGRLREAVRDLNALIISAQETMTAYVVPDGIDADQAIERVIELLDGPRQREVQTRAYAALKETP